MRSLSLSAPHSPSVWAAAATNSVSAARSQSHFHHHSSSINTHNTHIYTNHLQNFNSHHDRNYAHHLQHLQSNIGGGGPGILGYPTSTDTMARRSKLSQGLGSPVSSTFVSPSGAGGRRRSSSIRSRAPPPFIKFDPFADEPTSTSETTPSLSVTNPLAARVYSSNTSISAAPYTIQIPAAAPTEIQRYAPSASMRRLSFPELAPVPLSFGSANLSGGGGGFSTPVSRASSPAPIRRSTPSPPPRLQSGPGALGGPNVSKLVAGIMLNRMSVGKPMRKRVPSFGEKKEYVRSSLSSVVSVDA